MKSSYVVGIGCRRDVSVEQIDAAVRASLGSKPFAEIRAIASVDIKRDERALSEFAQRYGLPLMFFSTSEIADLKVPTPSLHVQTSLGVDGVCEPCALLASNNGKLVVAKQAVGGVTVAIAQDGPATSGQNA